MRQPISAQDDISDCRSIGATVMRQPSMTTSCVAPAKPSARENTMVQASQCAGLPKAIPASARITPICEMMIQPRRRPSQRPNTGAS